MCRFISFVCTLQLEIQSLRGENWDSIIQFNPATFCVPVPSQDLNFERHMSWSFFVLSEWRGEMIVGFVDIGGIVDHHCLNFLFIRYLWSVLDIQQQTLSTWNALWRWSQTFDRIPLLKYHNLVGNVRCLHCLPVNRCITS